ncbi:MAG: glutathione peroxidase [Frankiaceae bacterium]
MALLDVPVTTIEGDETTLNEYKGEALLIVNVASRCGFTKQYAGLERIYERYADRGFAVLGFPCNQFGEQEPGTEQEIQEFCSTTWNVTFPLFAKIEVNGDNRHPLFAALTETPTQDGRTGDVEWNFEKFLISPDGDVVARFSTGTEPEAPSLIEALEAQLPR